MALASLKSDLAQIQKNFGSDTTTAGNTAISRQVGVKKDLDTSTLPRTNILDKRGNIPIEYNINNPFQPTINKDISRIQIHWESGVDKNYYARGLSNEDELGYRNNDKFGFDQPFVIREIGDRWGFDAMSSWDAGIIRGGASTVVGRVARDVQRIGKFIFSPKGITYTLKQTALQLLNVGGDLGERANIYNPLSPLLNTIPLLHFKRHVDIAVLSDDIRERFVGSSIAGPFRSFTESAVYKKTSAASALLKFIGIGSDKPKLIDIEKTEQVIAIGQHPPDTVNNYHGNIESGYHDKVNLVPYGSKTIIELEKSEGDDFVPFRFKDVNNDKYIIFRALLSGITDNFTPEFAAERYVGRPDQVYVYQGTNREISFTFDIYPKTRQELPVLWEKMNFLAGLVYPSWAPSNGGLGMIAPFIELTIGDMYKDTPGFLSQLSLTVQDGTTWEIDDWKLPKYIQANCSFTYIGKYLPNQIGKHYELPWLEEDREQRHMGTFLHPSFLQTEYPLRLANKTSPVFKDLGQHQKHIKGDASYVHPQPK